MEPEIERILVVDDEEDIRRFCARVLERMGFQVRTAENGKAGLDSLKERVADFVLTDLSMPVMDGIQFTEEVRHRYPTVDVVIMTAYPRLETAIPLLKSGAYDYLIKPFDKDVLVTVVTRCFQKRRLSAELNREKTMRQELEAAYAELQKLEHLKEAFLSRVNHELRTPLVPALLALESLAAESSSPQAKKLVGAVQTNLSRMQEVVENLLVFSEIRKEPSDFYTSRVDLADLLDGVVRKYRPQCEARDVRVEVDFPKGRGVVWASPRLMETAFKHLLINAIQFNRKGGSIRIEGKDAGGRIEIVFRDSGIGIPPDKLSKIFDSFYQVAEYLTREVGGLGLGLALVRRILEAHGGAIRAESDGKTGSAFHLEIPAREPIMERVLGPGAGAE